MSVVVMWSDVTLFSFTNSVLQNSKDLIAAVDSELRLVGGNAHLLREVELVFGIRDSSKGFYCTSPVLGLSRNAAKKEIGFPKQMR